MKDSSKRSKSTLLINPRFQWTLIGYVFATTSLILLTVYGLISFGFGEFRNMGLLAGFPEGHVYFEFIDEQIRSFKTVLVAISVIVALILFIGGAWLSHRIAGPLHRLEEDLKKMTQQDPPLVTEIKFRKNDFFQEIGVALNSLAEKQRRYFSQRQSGDDHHG